jgi:MFS family permease
LNPYLSFAVSAIVELLAYIFVHLILDRIGRKIPYCSFTMLFGLVAILVLPVQRFTIKDSQGLFTTTRRFRIERKLCFAAQVLLMNTINVSLKFLASASYAIIYIYANELFPTNIRNTGMGICSMVARIGAITGTLCNDSLVSQLFCW